jgi:hypothetical protein
MLGMTGRYLVFEEAGSGFSQSDDLEQALCNCVL